MTAGVMIYADLTGNREKYEIKSLYGNNVNKDMATLVHNVAATANSLYSASAIKTAEAINNNVKQYALRSDAILGK